MPLEELCVVFEAVKRSLDHSALRAGDNQTNMDVLAGGAIVGEKVETIVETPKADQIVSALMPSIPRQTLSKDVPPLLPNLFTARRGLVPKDSAESQCRVHWSFCILIGMVLVRRRWYEERLHNTTRDVGVQGLSRPLTEQRSLPSLRQKRILTSHDCASTLLSLHKWGAVTRNGSQRDVPVNQQQIKSWMNFHPLSSNAWAST